MVTVPVRIRAALAVTSGLWAGVLVWLEWPDRPILIAVAATVWFAAAAWLVTRRPWPGVAATAVGVFGLGWLGLPLESAAPMGPVLIALMASGYLLPAAAGVGAVLALLAAAALTDDWDLPSLVFGAALLTAPWFFGWLVRGRDLRRQQAVAEAAELAGRNPGELARAAAESERARASVDAFGVIEAAVAEMTATAVSARGSLDRATIGSIRQIGDTATRHLHGILILLRTARTDERTDRSAPDVVGEPAIAPRRTVLRRSAGMLGEPAIAPRRTLLRRSAGMLGEPAIAPRRTVLRRSAGVLVQAWPAALVLLDVILEPRLLALSGEAPPARGVVFWLAAVLPVLTAVIGRRRFPAASSVVLAAVVAANVGAGVVSLPRDGLWIALASSAVSWSVGRLSTRMAALCWVVLVVSTTVVVLRTDPENLPIHLVALLVPFIAGAAWAGQLAAETIARAAAGLRRQQIATAERQAVADARVQLARDLHDAASHAVGTMMMQANAALVLRERDPDAARAALDTVIAVGRDVGRRLRTVANATSPAPGLADGLDAIRAYAERVGSEITIDDRIAGRLTPEDAALALRVVHEGVGNAVRHAQGSNIRVELVAADDHVRLHVINSGTSASSTRGAGLGLQGLRESVAARGGQVSATPTPDGGFALIVEFPAHLLGSEIPADTGNPEETGNPLAPVRGCARLPTYPAHVAAHPAAQPSEQDPS